MPLNLENSFFGVNLVYINYIDITEESIKFRVEKVQDQMTYFFIK